MSQEVTWGFERPYMYLSKKTHDVLIHFLNCDWESKEFYIIIKLLYAVAEAHFGYTLFIHG
jgi:hypothetical protein